MAAPQQRDTQQTALWNGPSGNAWVEMQETLDQMFEPIEELLVEAVSAAGASQVLDVGCGTGSTTLAVARRLGAKGACTGIDISEPMIAAALARAEREGIPASFVVADAQTHPFTPASFDMIVSRFGVMFFDDPVGAFANLLRAAKKGARLHLIAWRGAADNPFMTTAQRAAAPLLPDMPSPLPGAPGQFGFADERRVRRILEESGWAGTDIQPIEIECSFPEKDLVGYLSRFGPVGRTLREAEDTALRTRVIETIRPAFAPYVHGAEVRFTAACWVIRARAATGQTA